MNLHGYRHILLYGGAFDPPHVGHATLPELVRQALGAEVVAYLPAGHSPFKPEGHDAPAADRLAMLRLALGEQPRAMVLTDELDRAAEGRFSYTVETLEALRPRLAPEARLGLLIGADHARQFHRWRQWRRILELAEPVVMLRPPETQASLLASLPNELEPAKWAQRIVDTPLVDVSSSEVRRRVGAGEPIAGMVAEAVARYIQERGLYGSR